MFSTSTSNYDQHFPTLERKVDLITNRSSKPLIQSHEVQREGNKIAPLSVSSSDSQDVLETPPSKVIKEEIPYESFQAMAINHKIMILLKKITFQ